MAKVAPFHSKVRTLHHDNNQCKTGNNIETSTRCRDRRATALQRVRKALAHNAKGRPDPLGGLRHSTDGLRLACPYSILGPPDKLGDRQARQTRQAFHSAARSRWTPPERLDD